MIGPAALRDDIRVTVGDRNLLLFGSDSDAMSLAPSGECCLPKAKRPLNGANAKPISPVHGVDKTLDDVLVGEIEFHSATITTIVDLATDARHLCDLSVLDDESYVANGVVVHNCRSVVRSLRKRQAERKGITKEPSTEPAQKGFGLPPDEGEWEPDTQKYPPEIRDELEARLGRINNADIEPDDMPRAQ
jgi:hypothetical protein